MNRIAVGVIDRVGGGCDTDARIRELRVRERHLVSFSGVL